MTRIVEFEILGLAGRAKPARYELSPDVNVFFGLNGTGKTTLLKVLHSALRGNSASIRRLPFSAASVTFYSHKYDATYTRTIDRTLPSTPEDEADYELVELDSGEMVPVRVGQAKVPDWTTTPEAPNRFATTYLSTSRLAVMEDPRLAAPGRFDQQGLPYDEALLDRLFADQMRQLWRRYSNRALSEVRQIQQSGLAEILQSLFNPSSDREPRALDAKTAYARANDFLARQGVHNATGSLASFTKRYEADPRLGGVVDDIDAIERQIERAEEPRRKLQELVRSFLSEGKKIAFNDRDISVQVGEEEIPLASLSSGEKQLLRILVGMINAEESTVLIDEPELSMHIDWQRELISGLRTINSEAQLIVATHSPEIMANVPDSEIFRL
jgi:predicted ATPase